MRSASLNVIMQAEIGVAAGDVLMAEYLLFATERYALPILQPLADATLKQDANFDPQTAANDYLNEEVPDAAAALAGAQDIIAETISDDAHCRAELRRYYHAFGMVKSVKAKDEDSVYTQYYDYTEPVAKIPGHRILALDRGEREGFLKVSIAVEAERDPPAGAAAGAADQGVGRHGDAGPRQDGHRCVRALRLSSTGAGVQHDGVRHERHPPRCAHRRRAAGAGQLLPLAGDGGDEGAGRVRHGAGAAPGGQGGGADSATIGRIQRKDAKKKKHSFLASLR